MATIAQSIRHHTDDCHQRHWGQTSGWQPLLLDDVRDVRKSDACRRQAAVVARTTVDAAAPDEVPFFIIGSPRSGTSLSSRMLNEHPRLGVPFETTIVEVFHDMAGTYGPLDDSDNRRRLVADILAYPTVRDVRPRVTVEQAMAAIKADDIAGVMDGILTAWVEQQGKRRWGEKTPSNAFHFDTVAAWFPRAKFVHVIRDGRDVAKSLVAAPFGPKTLFTAAERWQRHVRVCQKIGRSLPSDQYMELRYEDLLDRPEQELRRVCVFLGEPFDAGMLRYFEQPTYYPTDDANARNLGRRLIVANKQKWRRTMTPSEVEMVEASVAPTLRLLGYGTVTGQRRMGRLERFFRAHLEPLPYRALSMLRNRRGQAEGLARLGLRAKRWRSMILSS